MSAPRKKRAADTNLQVSEPPVEDSDDEDIGDDYQYDEDMEKNEVDEPDVQIDFEAKTLEDSDFHGVRKLLLQLFLKANIDLSQMAETLISQNYVGSAIKQADQDGMTDPDDDSDEDLDIFGIISVLNITERKNLDCVKQLKSTLLERSAKCGKETSDKLKAILNDDSQQLGFIINERFINIPPQIAVPSFDCLSREMEAANQKKMKYDFANYLFLSKTYALMDAGASKSRKGSKKETRIFVNAEEEVFLQESSLSFDYSVKSERDTVVDGGWEEEDGEMEPLRTVMVMSASRLPAAMARMKELYSLPAT